MTIHIGAAPGQIAETVLMPGDPYRARWAAETFLENPVLIEQESFSEALLAVFHLTDELACRDNLSNLPESDKNHLSRDINRAYKKLVVQWFIYLKHLKMQYPYLYSLAVRKNPFDPNANPVVLS